MEERRKTTKNRMPIKRELPFYLMLVPGVIFTLVFAYLPMFGLVMAFQDFSPLRSFQNSPFVGLENFKIMFSLPGFWGILRNTLFLSVSKIILRLLLPLVVALLINEVTAKKFKRITQTILFLPYFLSWAVLGGILRELFDYNGMINGALTSVTNSSPILFFGSNFWFPIIIIFSDIWKDLGYNMIIYLAAITNVDPSLHESAAMDGASRFQQVWHITLPSIRPIVIMLFVLALGSVLSAGFEQILLLYNPMVYASSDIIDTFVYRLGLINNQWSLSAAVGMMKSVISLVLVSVSYYVAHKHFDYQIF